MKKTVCLIAAVLLLVQITYAKTADDYPQKFWDVPKEHWAFVYIADLAQRGVINGYENGSFKPSKTITRAEWAKIMVDAAGLQISDDAVYFTDMSKHWANKYVNAAKNYLTGYTDGSYRPNQAATREDVTVAMVRLKGYDLSEVDYSNLSKFTDVDSISDYAKGYVSVAIQNDFISGFENNTFRGQDTLTRAEASALLYRAFQHGNADKTVTAPTEPVKEVLAAGDNKSNAEEKSGQTAKNDNTEIEDKKNESADTNTGKTDDAAETEPEEEKKEYKVDTLASVSVESFTYDDKDTVYYISDNNIYSLNILSGEESMIYDTSKLSYKAESGAEYSGYTASQVIYDKYGGRLVLNGCYTQFEVPFKGDEQVSRYVAYDVTNDSLLLDWDSSNIFGYGCVENAAIKAFVGKDKAVLTAGEDDVWLVNTKTVKRIDVMPYNGVYFPNGKDLYIFNNNSSYSSWDIRKYDFADAKSIEMFNISSCSAASISGKFLYYWNGNDAKFYKANLSSGKIEKMNITVDSENCDILDMLPINQRKIAPELIMGSEEYIVFYDTSAEAFRVLSKMDNDNVSQE